MEDKRLRKYAISSGSAARIVLKFEESTRGAYLPSHGGELNFSKGLVREERQQYQVAAEQISSSRSAQEVAAGPDVEASDDGRWIPRG